MPDPQDERAAYIDGLRQFAQVLEDNPDIGLPLDGRSKNIPLLISFGSGDGVRERMAAAVRAFPCTWDKSVSSDDKWLNLTGRLAGVYVQLYAERELVCTRRVVGTEEREVEEVVTPAVVQKVRKEVEVVEWDCGPLLRPALPASREPAQAAL